MVGESHRMWSAAFALVSMVVSLLVLSAPSNAAAAAYAQGGSAVRLNETQTANTSTLVDANGETPDWIELRNTSDQAVALSGWGLSDRSDEPSRWQFPVDASIGAQSTLIVFAGGDPTGAAGEVRADFSLSAGGEFLGLYDSTGALVSAFNPIPAIPADTSWGVGADGTLNLFSTPTPNAANGSGSLGLTGDVAATPQRGFYSAPISVTLVAEAGASIRYTTDRSVPSATNGAVYTAPISVSSTTVLRAVTIRDGWTSAKPVTHTYVFAGDQGAATVIAGIESLPVISLTAASSTFSQTTQVPVAVEMIFPDGAAGFQVDAGIKESGGTSVAYPKDTYRLSFGSEWGESSLEFPVFNGADNPNLPAVTSFKRLTLRMGSHDGGWWDNPRSVYRAFTRARWHDETMLDLGHTDTHGRFVSVYLNGSYWGQYHLREFFDDHFMASYHGGDNEDYVAINRGNITSGAGNSWNEFVAARSNWETFSQIVDPVNFIDFMLVSEYGGNNWDLRESQNWRGAGPAEVGAASTGYVFSSSDPDISLLSTTARTAFPGPKSSWSNLIAEADPDFLSLVHDRIQHVFSDGGALSPPVAAARWTRISDQIDQSVHGEYARWGRIAPSTWVATQNWFATTLFPQRTDALLSDFRARGLLSPVAAPSISASGTVPSGTPVNITSADAGAIYVTTDGSDPRLAGGGVSPTAANVGTVFVTGDVVINARVLSGVDWSALSTATIDVQSEPPLVTNPGPRTVAEGAAFSYQVVATDDEAITFSAAGLPDGLGIDPVSGLISGQPAWGDGGVHPVSVTVTDATNAATTVSFDFVVQSTFGGAPAVVLNEYNAVAPDSALKNNGSDSYFGTVVGNGGDWFEVVTVSDGLDMRGWSFEIWSRNGGDEIVQTASLTLGDASVLATLRAGTLLTVAESVADDLSYDPRNGDWTLQLQANDAQQGSAWSTQSNFDTNNDKWRLVIRDAAGELRSVVAGETEPWDDANGGVSGSEVFALGSEPSAGIDRITDYRDMGSSTFGAPNTVDGVTQSFEAVRPDISALGDVNCDGRISVADAIFIAQYSVGNRVAATCPLSDPTSEIDGWSSDITGDGRTSVADALGVAQCSVGLPNNFCPD